MAAGGDIRHLTTIVLLLRRSWLQLQASLMHFVNIASGLEIADDKLLQLRDGLEEKRRSLKSLNISDDCSCLSAFAEVDHP